MRTVSTIYAAGLLAFTFGAIAQGQTAQNREGAISWSVPEDGGTPRDPGQIERLGPQEFRVRAVVQEGFSPLAHAVSRVDLICRNAGPAATPVTVHIDLSNDGQRTEFDSKPEGGMPKRDFIFIQTPGREWEQVEGKTEGWIATVRFNAAPGDTKVGLSPWYTYDDYLRFVRGLPEHRHLKKEMFGKSDGGREHWEVTITDADADAAGKRKIFWHAREHAYETFSSFAMEGLVRFLLSDEASAFRKQYVITLHPMTNVDGVADGFEYRAGYDFPQPRLRETGRLTFATIDRLRPDFAVAWHNWIAPRDRNVVFYTDEENGKTSARAWLRFTQLFPSLRGADHRWRDQTTPLKYNWHGRQLSDHNVHQYAMKTYGTRVWGWEMPWWNQTVSEARMAGAGFGRAFLRTLEEIRTTSVPVAVEQPRVEVPRWEMHEFTVTAAAHVENPYRDAALVGEFTSPRGKSRVVDGFHDGGKTWRLRFAPDEEGEWTYQLRGEGIEVLQRGRLRCTAARGAGFTGVHPRNPYAFAHADGTAFLPMGDTCYGLYDDSPITPELRSEYLKARRGQRFNFVRMTVGHSESRAAADTKYWAWGGTAKEPDLDRLNPEFFSGFDQLFRELRAAGMNVELIVLNFYRRPFTNPKVWTAARERLWLRYLAARYGAFDNLFLWTIANEYETHPDGQYRLDYPSDVEWAKATARFIKANDPHGHLVTVHPVVSASRKGESPRAPFESPWRIGEFFGAEKAIDVLSQQTGQSGEGVVWDEKLQCWNGNSETLVASIAADRRFAKPVLNTENGYEYLRGHATGKKQVHHTDKVRRSSWRILCAGGTIAAGFHGTIGHSDVWNRTDAPNHYTFTVKDEGAAGQLGVLHEFFSALPFWRMDPFAGVSGEAVALAEKGAVYVVYLPRGGACALNLSEASGRFKARWFDPRTGKFGEGFELEGGRTQEVTAPGANDYALLVEKPVAGSGR